MEINGIIHRQMLGRVFVSLIFFLLILLPSGCGTENQSGTGTTGPASDTETASASLTIRWHHPPSQQDSALFRTAALDCQATSVGNVVVKVYDASNNHLVTGGPWPCTTGGGRIDRIPVGQDRRFVVLAEDADGNVRYQGETAGIAINAGEITQGVVVDARLFIPTLTAPANNVEVDLTTVSLEWGPVDNADEYVVQVAEDIDFQTIIIDKTTPALVDAPSNLQPSTDYFWKIFAVDAYTNMGAASEVRSFATSNSGCAFTIDPANQSVVFGGGTYGINVSASNRNCEWTASENSDWISLTPASGSGDGSVGVTVSANTGAARSAQITIGGQIHTVSQAQAGCTYTIAPASQALPTSGGVYNVTVSATHGACDWTASENSNWITLTPNSGAGIGSVQITVSANTGAARSAQITIAGQAHTVTQAAAVCSYTINPTNQQVPAAGSAYNVTVSATHGGCDWTASETSNWITLTPNSGAGNGSVQITVSANTGAARSAQITIAGQTHTVTQAAAVCTYTINPASQNIAAAGATYNITVAATHGGCLWAVSENVDWISVTPVSGAGGGTVRVTVSANTDIARSAQITIAGQTHTVTQEAADCTYTITPPNQIVPAEGSTYDISVSATHGGCNWTATENSNWISLAPASGAGSGIVRVTVSANTGPARSAQISVAGQLHTVRQSQRVNTGPSIGNASFNLLSLNDDRCSLSLPLGSLFEVTFNYSDDDGNGPNNINQANLSIVFDFPFGVDGRFDNYTWNSSLSGDGFNGSAITWQCYRFDNNGFVDVTMTIVDQAGAVSNPLTITIDRPSGSN